MTTLTIFDLDDTLFYCKANIYVNDHAGNRLFRVDSSNTYELKHGEQFDYDEFRSSRLFYDTCVPIDKMVRKYKNMLKRKKDTDKIVIITARSDFDNQELFLSALDNHGVYHEDVHVHRAGNLIEHNTTPARKCAIINAYLQKNDFKKVRIFDDSFHNLQAFLEMKKHHHKVKFQAFHVKEDGCVSRFKTKKL